MTLLYLDGENEDASDTIRRFLHTHVSIPNTRFISEGGVDQGGSDVTPTHPAYVDIPSTDGTNTIRLTFRADGTPGNEWEIFLRSGASAAVDLQSTRNPPRWRITAPNPTTMQEFDTLISDHTDITDTLVISSIQGSGDPTLTRVDFGTYEFDHGQDSVVNRENEMTSSEMRGFRQEAGVFVKCRAGDDMVLESTNDFAFYKQAVYIDIFGKHAHSDNRRQINRVRDQINDAVLNHMNGPYRKSFEDKNSAILGFENHHIDWQYIPEDGENGIMEQLSGELYVHFQRFADTD